MYVGKIPPDVLKKQILPFLGAKRAEVLVGPKFGEDCAVLELGDYLLALSCDPITGTASDLGRLAVHVSCNDIAATGAEPVGLLLTFLFPPQTAEEEMQLLVKETHRVAGNLGVAILGGHTEVTSTVQQVVIAATALGKVKREHLVTSSGARAGDDVIITKWAGLEGTVILATDLAFKLREILPGEVIDRAKKMGEYLSVVPEGIIAAKAGATAMHDATEGGVLGALVELASASEVGMEIWQEAIPLTDETRLICQSLQIDPLALISSGAMLITSPAGSGILEVLESAGITAHVIGKVSSGPDMVMVNEGRKTELKAPLRDELYKALERFSR